MVDRNFDCAIAIGSVQIVQIFAHLHFDLSTSHTIINVFDVHTYIFGFVYNWLHTLHVCMQYPLTHLSVLLMLPSLSSH